jgi:hypothetical protein
MTAVKPAIDVLIRDLDSLDSRVCAAAKIQLLQLGAGAVEPLIAAAQGSNLRVSWRAIGILSEIDDTRWIEPIKALLRSTQGLVAQAAVGALHQALGEQALDYLLEVLPDSKTQVSVSILQVIEQYPDPRICLPLCQMLQTTTSSEVRYNIIQILGRLGDSQVIPLIRSFANDDNHHVRERVEIALARLEGRDVDELID